MDDSWKHSHSHLNNRQEEVILLVHGIRTFANWQPMVKRVLEEIPQTKVIPIKYGYLDSFRFWFPLLTRRAAINEIRREIGNARTAHGDARISVIAHSFGTYAIAEILREHPDIKLHRLVLCGSILPREYRWDFVGSRLTTQVINDYGTKDIWPVLAKTLSWGYGDTGRHGFGRGAFIIDRAHNYAHSDFFNERFVRKYWTPFFERGKIVASAWAEKAPPTPWLLATFSTLPLKTIFLAIAILWMLTRLTGNHPKPSVYPISKPIKTTHSNSPHSELPQTICVQLLPCNPSLVTQLDLTQTVRTIKDGLHKDDKAHGIDLVSNWTESVDGIQQHLLSNQPRIVQIHGGELDRSQFLSRIQDGKLVATPDATIRKLFSWLRPEVPLIILDRAMSESQAAAVREESQCTITIPPRTPPTISLTYLTSLYRNIGQGESVRTAHDSAIAIIQGENEQISSISLTSRSDCDPSFIRLVAPAIPQHDSTKLKFVQIEMATNQCLWEEMRRFRHPEAPPYNPLSGRPWFNQTYSVAPKAEYAFGSHQLINYYWPDEQLAIDDRVADPVLEFSVLNQDDINPTVISRIGFRTVNAWNSVKAAPLTFKINSVDAYELPVKDFVIGGDQTLRLPDPVYLAPKAAYRFRLRLKDYARGAKVNETVIRLFAVANTDTILSDEIYLGIIWLDDPDDGNMNAPSPE